MSSYKNWGNESLHRKRFIEEGRTELGKKKKYYAYVAIEI